MVASASVDASRIGKTRECSGPELYFARLIACEGYSPSRAYRVAWKPSLKSDAATLASKVLARPHVQAKIAELRAAADREAVMDMVRRRRMLADIAEAGWRKRKGHAKPADAIAAIREDAILAGERRTDGTQVNVAGDVSFTVVLQALKQAGQAPVPAVADQPVVDVPAQMPALAVSGDSGEVSGAEAIQVCPERESRSEREVNVTLEPCGPLGRIVGAGPMGEPSALPGPAPLGFDE